VQVPDSAQVGRGGTTGHAHSHQVGGQELPAPHHQPAALLALVQLVMSSLDSVPVEGGYASRSPTTQFD